jgi:hypothetical protein
MFCPEGVDLGQLVWSVSQSFFQTLINTDFTAGHEVDGSEVVGHDAADYDDRMR